MSKRNERRVEDFLSAISGIDGALAGTEAQDSLIEVLGSTTDRDLTEAVQRYCEIEEENYCCHCADAGLDHETEHEKEA